MMNLIQRISQKSWSEESIEKYVGDYFTSYFAYASDISLRNNAASGGVITALLKNLLELKQIDGALVCRRTIEKNHISPKFMIAENLQDLLSAQGSIYTAVDFITNALPLIKDYNGNLAVVALPCDIKKLKHICEKDKYLSKKIKLSISLFCGHNSRLELTEMVINKLRPQNASLKDFRYRFGRWRGYLRAEFDNGNIVEKPFSYFSDYQNLYYFCQQKCHHCSDHTGFYSDISIGDIWTLEMKENPIKHSAVILRTEKGKRIFENSVRNDVLVALSKPIEDICQGQARTMPFHYNVSARSRAGKLLGMEIRDTVNERVRINDFMVALIVLYNEKLSRSKFGQMIISVTPRFILKLNLYFMKALESI